MKINWSAISIGITILAAVIGSWADLKVQLARIQTTEALHEQFESYKQSENERRLDALEHHRHH